MRFIIDFVFIIFSFFYLVFSLLKGKSLSSLKKRFCVVDEELNRELQGKRPIWLHAVSVGEAISTSALINLMCERFPEEKIIVSTVTQTGNKIAKKVLPKNVSVIYLPLDLSFIVKKAISSINPKLFILTETEFWPNLILGLKNKNIPIAVINGRISNKSFFGYRMTSFIFKRVLGSIELFCMRSKEDAKKIVKLGVLEEKVEVTGSTKFDLALSYEVTAERKDYLKHILNISDKDTVLVCGSTHNPEERMLGEIYLKLLQGDYSLRLIIVPRHIQRIDNIKKEYDKLGLEYQLFSFISESNPASKKVILVDKLGVLRDLYSICSLAFVGGSLIKRGGHNLLEPAGLRKAVIFGKWVYNFKEEAQVLIRAGAGIMVADKEKLVSVLPKLIKHEEKLTSMGEAAFSSLKERAGATVKDLEFLEKLLPK